MDTFTEQLSQARRTSRLSGQPMSQNISAGISEGAGMTAAGRVLQKESLAQQNEQMRIAQERLRASQQAQEKQQQLQKMGYNRAVEQQKGQESTSEISNVITGAVAGWEVGGFWGAVAGAGVMAILNTGDLGNFDPTYASLSETGILRSNDPILDKAVKNPIDPLGLSHFCTASEEYSEYNDGERFMLRQFKRQALRKYPDETMDYLENAPAVLERLRVEGTLDEYLGDFKQRIADPVLNLFQLGKFEDAFKIYSDEWNSMKHRFDEAA